MLEYVDVSRDPSARARSGVDDAQMAEARALGFELTGWIASVFRSHAMVSAVFAHRSGRMLVELTRDLFDEVTFKTLFEDGTIVATNSKPPEKHWRRIRHGIFPPARHRIDFAVFELRSIAELATHHEARVRAYEELGHRPLRWHDRRTALAIKKRWREVSAPRMRRQLAIAMAIGIAVCALALVAGFGAPHLLPKELAMIAGAILTLGAFGAVPAGYVALVLSLRHVAPVLARNAPAPPPRPATELLALADTVKQGLLPPEATSRPSVVVTSAPHIDPAELARMQRVDLGIAIVDALAMPVLALGGLFARGEVGALVAVGAVFVLDGVLLMTLRTTRGDLLRALLVPKLVDGGACAGRACALNGRWLGCVWVVLGALCLVGAHETLAAPSEPIEPGVLVQWLVIVAFLVFMAISRTRSRHRRFA